jgi:DNA-binding MarR family transcriptional regulator
VKQEDDGPVAADALRRAEWAVQARKEQRLRGLGIAAGQYSLLISVHTDPGLTGAEPARRLNITPQAVASQVARLEKLGAAKTARLRALLDEVSDVVTQA